MALFALSCPGGREGVGKTKIRPASRRKAALAWVEERLEPLIAALELESAQRTFMRERWLDQVRWAEGKAATSQWWYRRLRLIAIVGGVIIREKNQGPAR